MRSRWRENVSKEGRIRGYPHLTMDGDRDRDPHWSTGLSPQTCFVCMYWLFVILVFLDAQFPRPGGRGEEPELPAGQKTQLLLGLEWEEERKWRE